MCKMEKWEIYGKEIYSIFLSLNFSRFPYNLLRTISISTCMKTQSESGIEIASVALTPFSALSFMYV